MTTPRFLSFESQFQKWKYSRIGTKNYNESAFYQLSSIFRGYMLLPLSGAGTAQSSVQSQALFLFLAPSLCSVLSLSVRFLGRGIRQQVVSSLAVRVCLKAFLAYFIAFSYSQSRVIRHNHKRYCSPGLKRRVNIHSFFLENDSGPGTGTRDQGWWAG